MIDAKKVAIVQSNYIPWKGYFDIIASVDEFIVLDEVQFTKNDWRNRNKVKTSNGLKWLTIPVKHERLSQSISSIQTIDGSWASKHWKSLVHSYSRSPYFGTFAKVIEGAYKEAAELRSLSAINLLFIKLICRILEITTVIRPCTDYVLQDDRVARLVSLCEQASANSYLSGPAAREYIDENAFAMSNIAIAWADYTNYPEYDQLFPPFAHGVSVLDLIFNVGADAKNYISKF